MAGLLRQLEHVPIATVVRLPSNAPAPIGRILDADADAAVIAMVETGEQAADAVTAARYAPRGVRSFGLAATELTCGGKPRSRCGPSDLRKMRLSSSSCLNRQSVSPRRAWQSCISGSVAAAS